MEASPVTPEQVLARARAVFRTAEAALAWYTLPNARLGDTPRALVERGEGERVLAELQRLPPPEHRVLGLPARWWRG